MFKLFFQRLWTILFFPAKAWKQIALDRKAQYNYRRYFFLPMIALVSVAAFLDPIIRANEVQSVDLLNGLRNFVLLLVSYVASSYAAPPMMNLYNTTLGQEKDYSKAEKLWLYALTPVFLVRIFTSLFQDFFFLYIFIAYTVYLVWEAGECLYQIEDKQRPKFTAVNTVIILLMPFIIEWLLKWLIPGLAK